ncbi:MAG: flagellin [Ruminococcus sp.]|nr:flagellin [Ruminococcus sp.]
MSMVVRTNTMALNANNALNKNNSTVAGNLEKLSTGFKINRAADDASGLAISEKMKAQIKALDTASKNAEDGASLIKTAEGYMGEVHDMLNRIVELAEKSANGTYETIDDGAASEGAVNASTKKIGDTGTDRKALQDEVDQLCAEMDRIATTANFNQLKLFNGEMTTTAAKGAAVAANAATKNVGDIITATEVSEKAGEGSALTLQIGETSTASDKLSVSMMNLKTEYLFNAISGSSVVTQKGATSGSDAPLQKTVALTAKNTQAESYNSNALTLNISNQTSASVIAEKVRDVINDVSASRANLGAMENRLDYTINNLTTASENITDANSRIRDTDMAKTMMQYTQGNTLTQAAQAMLAQANQAPSSVLQLLQ